MARATQETIDLLNDYFGAMEVKDYGRLRSFYAEDVTLTFANHPTVTGADTVLAVMAELNAKLRRLEHRLLRVWEEDGDVVIFEVRSIYHLHDGSTIELTACSIFTITSQQLTDLRIYVDHTDVDAALG